jgi:hypothetical protein
MASVAKHKQHYAVSALLVALMTFSLPYKATGQGQDEDLTKALAEQVAPDFILLHG